ncbi:Leucine-rich repeat protein kinase family protein [Forsythia ovata]|uniref:non-specific serine/threonine protein kinase n=1 Tax=Forsythia ovata TaxID=205694 RepID=A0ABD1R328_9LAMI
MNGRREMKKVCKVERESGHFQVCGSDSSANVNDESILLDFRNMVTNPDDILTYNWTKSTSFCNWIGVTCSPGRQRVMALKLPNMNLEGTISPSIANFSFLVELDISNNSFRGDIPLDLFRSQKLETMSLAYNKFSGDLWKESWNVPELRILNLSRNSLSGSIHSSIGNVSKLERLILYENIIGGSIPSEIGNLSSLRDLDLSRNRFTGSIPPSIFNVSSLRAVNLSNNSLSGAFLLTGEDDFLDIDDIDLSYNQLIGEIPSSLCRFRGLRSLYLSYNNFTGQIPRNIGCLTKLEKFYVTENKIDGNIPPSLGNISSLQFLGYVKNSISGHIPDELGKLFNLQMLGFDYNNLTGEIPPVIFNLSSLVYIAFTDNSLSGRIPATLGLQLPNLEGIYLADNMLEGEIPISITNASRLKELELSYNFFTGSVPYNLGNLRDLLFLNLAGNQLTNEPRNPELGFIDSLVECTMLQFLIVGNNPLKGILPDSVQNLSSSIEMFNIENGQIYGQIPNGIGNMSSMLSLVLNGNNLTGNIPSEIGYLRQLQRLYLSNNKLKGHIPVELCNLVNLGDMILSENNLSGSVPECIGNLSRLQKLMLGYNRLTSSLPFTLWEVKNLLFLNVSQNFIQGDLPLEIGRLETLEGLDLSSNELSGQIPIALGDQKNLRYLSLSINSLEGSIPSSFGNLISLEFLDLSSNGLSGSIPNSMERLLYLREINLSNNNLEGAIPTGGVFANSSPQSYIGNRGLCSMTILEFPRCANTSSPRGSRSKTRILRITIPVMISVALIIVSLTFWILYRQKKERLGDPELSEIPTHQMVPYRELLQATDNFSESNLLGVGSSGSVFKGILSDGNLVAIKVLNLKDEEICKRFDAECEVMRRIRHRNLVKVITTCSNEYIRAIVLQYMPNGNLENWLHRQDYVLDLLQRINIMLDVAMAIEYLHHGYDDQVVHCDLKPANVLLDADMVAHVSDFGISKILAQDKSNAQTNTLGTIGYIAPEYGSQGTVSTAGDVYSFGIMLLEALSGKRPTDEIFPENLSLKQWVTASHPNSLMEIIDSNLFQEEDEVNTRHKICISCVIELALDCSKEAPEERINMKEAVIRLANIRKKFLETNKTQSTTLEQHNLL